MRRFVFTSLVAVGALAGIGAGCGKADQAETGSAAAIDTLQAGAAAAATADSLTKTAVYTCSMHPQVRASAPGKCPTCGMNLEKAAQDSISRTGMNPNR